MASANNSINNTIGATISGVTNTLTITNGSNTASSAATCNISVGGTSSGNAWNQYTIGSSRSWSLGVNNGSSQALQINTNNSGSVQPGSGTNVWTMSTAGLRNMPLQCAFSAVAPNQANVTGDGTPYTVTLNSTLFDQSGSFNTGTSNFVVPITGIYLLCYNFSLDGITGAHNEADLFIDNQPVITINAATASAVGNLRIQGSLILSLTAGANVGMSIDVHGGAKTVSVVGGGFFNTALSGFLLA